MPKISNYPNVKDPIKGHFYKNSEKLTFVKTHQGWQRCCWYVLGQKKYEPDYFCPACRRSLLPKINTSEIKKLRLVFSDITKNIS